MDVSPGMTIVSAMDEIGETRTTDSSRMLAWGVHLFTATGVVFAMLAMAAIEQEYQGAALLWLLAAVIVDGIDGTLARAARVKAQLPRIDGDVLDLVIDYLTYVFVPAMFIWRGGYLPEWAAGVLTAAVLVSSLYVFARRDMKTDDGYFRGFPALWIGVAFFFFVLQPSQAVAAVAVAALIAATFAPIHVIHPFRATDYGALPIVLTAMGAIGSAALLIQDWHPLIRAVLVGLSVGSAAALVVLGVARTVRGPKPQ